MLTKTFLVILPLIFQTSLLEKIIPKYASTTKPELFFVDAVSDEKQIRLIDESITVILESSSIDSNIISLYRNNIVEANYKLSYHASPEYFYQGFSLDLNKDGVRDYFIVTYPFEATGLAAGIHMIACLISDESEGKWKLFELSSFLGSKELFLDYDNNGYLEYACVKMERVAKDTIYYATNFFSLKNGTFCSDTNKIIYARVTKEVEIISEIPNKLKNYLVLKEPKVIRSF